MARRWLRSRGEAPVLNLAIVVLIQRRGGQDDPQGDATSEGFTIIETVVVAVFMVVMLVLSALEAHHKLNALGLTLLLTAGFVATPKLLGNSMLRSAQAKQLQRIKATTPEDVAESLGVRNLLRLLLVLAVSAVLLELAGFIVMLKDGTSHPVGVSLFGGGALALFIALIGASLWTVTVPLAELVVGEAQETKTRRVQADPRDRAWVAALFLFLGGTLLQFADALLH